MIYIFYSVYASVINPYFYFEEYGLMIGLNCSDGAYPLRSNEIHGMTPEGYVQADPGNELLQHNQYCLEIFNNRMEVASLTTFVCFESPPEETEEEPSRYVVNIIHTSARFELFQGNKMLRQISIKKYEKIIRNNDEHVILIFLNLILSF